MKNKFITTVVATALALTMTFSLANGMDVKAAEITEDSETIFHLAYTMYHPF